MESKSMNVIETLPFALSQTEQINRMKKAVALKQELAKIEAEFLLSRIQYREKMRSLEKKIVELEAAVYRGSEEREVSCVKIINFVEEQVSYNHQGKVIYTRPISQKEKQFDMIEPFEEPKRELASQRPCITCNEMYHGTGAICHNCKKTEAYRFAREA